MEHGTGKNLLSSSQLSHQVAVIGLCLAAFIASLDASITNVALPNISHELNTSFSTSVWVVNSYQLVMVSFILPIAVWADRFSYKSVFISGILIFSFASLLCGIANSIEMLVFSRAIQGLGAAAILGTNIALVRLIYPAERLGLGLGINAFIIAIGLAGGPVIASVILTALSWHWLFLINIPAGIVACLFCYYLPKQAIPASKKLNIFSMLLCILMFSSLIYAMGGFSLSLPLMEILILTGIGILSGIVLMLRDAKHPLPVFPVDLFHHAIFTFSTFTALCAFITQGLVLVALPFIFHQAGFSQMEIGWLIFPWPLMGALTAPVAGLLTNRFSPAYLGSIGLLLLGSSIAVLSLLFGHLSHAAIITIMTVCGLGFGLFLTPNQRMLMASSPLNRSGAAGGMLNVARTLGQAVGAALVALFLSFGLDQPVVVLWIGSFFAFIAAILSLMRVRPSKEKNSSSLPS